MSLITPINSPQVEGERKMCRIAVPTLVDYNRIVEESTPSNKHAMSIKAITSLQAHCRRKLLMKYQCQQEKKRLQNLECILHDVSLDTANINVFNTVFYNNRSYFMKKFEKEINKLILYLSLHVYIINIYLINRHLLHPLKAH